MNIFEGEGKSMVRSKPRIIAEIGATHIGSTQRAMELIRLAALAGADYVKLQKRNPVESVPKHLQNKPHPNVAFSYGKTYLDHRIALELSIHEHAGLKTYCEEIGIGYSTSVWDITSAQEVCRLNPDFIKIPSACNLNFDLIQVLVDEFDGGIHISLGMIDLEEKKKIYWFIMDRGIEDRVVLYHCTSEYPCPFNHLYLLEIERLIEDAPVKCVGFSNHGYGISADVASYILGVEWIERHFIDDRLFRHSDSAASLEPDGMRRLCRDMKHIHQALEYKDSVPKEEIIQREKLSNHEYQD